MTQRSVARSVRPGQVGIITGAELSGETVRYLDAALRGLTHTELLHHLAEIDPKASQAYVRRRAGHSFEAIAQHQKCSVRTVQRALLRANRIMAPDKLPPRDELTHEERAALLRQRNGQAYEVWLLLSVGYGLKGIAELLCLSVSRCGALSKLAREYMG
jgi:hypothetical protein